MTENIGYKILSIDTSCDETSAAVTQGVKVLSNTIWSQASLHAKWGGVVPSVAQREHKKRIDWVIKKALNTSKLMLNNIDAVAVTVGPGLAIALEVGISKAKEICVKNNLPLITVNHIEGHLLSCLSSPKTQDSKIKISDSFFPAFGLVTSGGHTEIVLIKNIGNYKIIAKTADDALGESLDKSARFLGFGYPGGVILEKIAKEGNPKSYNLPIPMLGREKDLVFSYSGLKTAFVRLLKENNKTFDNLTNSEVSNLASSYQYTAFTHFIRVLEYLLITNKYPVKNIFTGGGVMANVTLRKMLRKTANKYNIKILFPFSKRLYGDNAAMIGIAAYFKYKKGLYINKKIFDKIERVPNAKVDKVFPWE